MSVLYPANPSNVPPQLTAPSAAYKRHAWLAMAALLGFVLAYCGLSFWFGWKAWKLLAMSTSGARDPVWLFVMGVGSGFLALFMLKALFFVNKGAQPDAIEITAAEQPQLFAFLERLARDTGAPKPARVFVSPRVNAAVFYDLSLLNLVFPSRKNLEIGLPLVNVLTLCELKAVLAHEFGHFAQRSMAVGRWVYIAQQIAGHLIGKRDALDAFLNGLSRFDIRVAWIGWILTIVVWSIRSIAESAFKLVVLAQRALSREMEFQADLVAVSVTGSEALIHALHRLGAADAAWDRAIGFANTQMAKGHSTSDLLAVQTRVLENLRVVLDDPHYGALPARDEAAASAQQRLFKPDVAQTSRMWATHPDNHEREANTKRIFVAAPLDETPAWQLFQEAQPLRERVTGHMIKHVEKPGAPLPMDQALASLDAEYARESFHARYKGLYLSRPAALFWRDASEMVAQPLPERVPDLSLLYPPSLSARLERFDELQREKAALVALHEGSAKPTGGVMQHRGKPITRKQLPAVIAAVGKRVDAIDYELQSHDRICRTVHRAIARMVGHGWEPYLSSLCALLHYAEHSDADLRDRVRVLANTVGVVTAAGPANKKGAARVLADAESLYEALRDVARSRVDVVLDAATAALLPDGDWNKTLGEFTLPEPCLDNLNDWIRAIDGWANQIGGALRLLRRAALDQLLISEGLLARAWQRDEAARALVDAGAPTPCRMPRDYPRLQPGQERKLQDKLPWLTRVQIADGAVPTLVRLGVAGGVLVGVLGFSTSAGTMPVHIVNGLQRPVTVSIAGQSVTVGAAQTGSVKIEGEREIDVIAKTSDGREIESFRVTLDQDMSPKVYNVAGASALVEWTAVYGGNNKPPAPRELGAKRWQATRVDHVFEEPPRSISSRSGGSTRSVLTALGSDNAGNAIGSVADSQERRNMVLAHARWDPADAPQTMNWLYAGRGMPGMNETLNQRLRHDAGDVIALRLKQDSVKGAEREALCREIAGKAQAAPASADLRYLATRCIAEAPQREAAFLQGHADAPKHTWFAYAAGGVLAGQTRWAESEAAYQTAMRGNPGVVEHVSVNIARMRRAAQGTARPALDDMLKQSQGLRTMWAWETGQGLEPGDAGHAFQALHKGQLESALKQSQVSPEFRKRMLWLVATSRGATRARIDEALASGPKSAADAGLLVQATALALREQRDVQPYLAAIDHEVAAEPAQLLRFIELLRTGAATTELEAAMAGWDAHERGNAYVMACIVLGDAAPAAWQQRAKLLLFGAERPYLG